MKYAVPITLQTKCSKTIIICLGTAAESSILRFVTCDR